MTSFFRQYIAGYTVANHTSRRSVIFARISKHRLRLVSVWLGMCGQCRKKNTFSKRFESNTKCYLCTKIKCIPLSYDKVLDLYNLYFVKFNFLPSAKRNSEIQPHFVTGHNFVNVCLFVNSECVFGKMKMINISSTNHLAAESQPPKE